MEFHYFVETQKLVFYEKLFKFRCNGRLELKRGDKRENVARIIALINGL